jgi:hypothetical protein
MAAMRGDPVVSRPRLFTAVRMLPAALRVLLRLRRLHRRTDLQGLVAAATPRGNSLVDRPDRARAAAWLARAIVHRLRWLFPQPCLYWALAGYHFLWQAARPAVIHFGLRKTDEELISHAWLTLDGQPVFDDPEQRGFVETIAFPGGDCG